MTKISQLTNIGSALAADDEFVVRDVSDISTPNKKVTSSGIIDYIISQGGVSGFSQIAAGVGPLARAQATSSGTTGTLVFSTAAATTLVERARIDSTGRLLVGTSTARQDFYNNTTNTDPRVQIEGVGTSSPGYILQSWIVNHNSATVTPHLVIGKSRGSTNGSVTIVQNGDSLGHFDWHGADGTDMVSAASIDCVVDGTPGTNDMPGRLVFSTTADGASSPTERMRITQAGFTKYSNTGFYLGATGAYHEFNTDQNNGNLVIRCTNTGAAVTGIEMQLAASTSSAAYHMRHSRGGIDVAYLLSEGDWRIAAGKTYGNISDERKKTNIVDATSKLEDLKNLRVRNFEPIGEPGNKCIGFIAQEFEQVFPSLVDEREEEQLVSTPVLDDDGNETGEHTTERIKTGESIKSIKETALIPILVKSLQEAVSKIETLEAKVAALEAS